MSYHLLSFMSVRNIFTCSYVRFSLFARFKPVLWKMCKIKWFCGSAGVVLRMLIKVRISSIGGEILISEFDHLEPVLMKE